MNNGFFGFPSANSEGTSKVTQFDSSGAYMIQPGTKRLYIFAVGGGGGGGGGARINGSTGCGGSGGGGGGMVCAQYNVEDLGGIGVSLIINIGAGGVGGAAGATDGASGTISSGSGSTQIYVSGKPGILINALAGLPGNPGTTVGGIATASTTFIRYNFPSSSAIIGISTAGAGFMAVATNITIATIWNHGGGGGGSTGNTGPRAGASIVAAASTTLSIISSAFTRSGTIYEGGLVNTATPPVNSRDQINGVFSPGIPGAGGGGATTVSANAGGNGYRGSGGGGGGGSGTGIAAGAGGNGGNGYVAIYAVI